MTDQHLTADQPQTRRLARIKAFVDEVFPERQLFLRSEGRVRYLLPGDGKLDMTTYFKAMADAGWDKYICPEVTGQIWNREDYDPWATAQFCYDALAKARAALG